MSIVTVERKILAKNDDIAAENRQIFKNENLFTINLSNTNANGIEELIINAEKPTL